MKRLSLLVHFLVIGLAGTPLLASAAGDHAGVHASHIAGKPIAIAQAPDANKDTSATAASSMTEGEIRKVDKDAGKITIKHAELKSLDMPPMTMVFQVKDKAMLDQIKAGDKVDFVADKVNGKLTVVQIETKK